MGDFDGQTAVVTGASSGIGRAIALALSGRGAELCLIGRDPGRLDEVATSVRSSGVLARVYRADLTRDEDLANLAPDLLRDCRSVHILVHCAGAFFMGSWEHFPVAQFDELYRIHVRAPFVLTQTLLPMLRSSRGQVVFINSSVGLTTRAGVGAYAACKHAVKALADTLRDEVNAAGVRVLSVYPGRTATPQQAVIHAQEGKVYRPDLLVQPEDVAATVMTSLSMPRTAEVTNLSVRPFHKT